ncbi:MAG: hypothetical protein WC426_02485 [Sulfuriferula sp.]
MNNPHIEFSKRLIELCTENGLKPFGRQAALTRVIGAAGLKVTQPSVKKWFDAEAIPDMDKCIVLAKWAKVSFEWLMTGRGDKRKISTYTSEPMSHIVQIMENMTPEQQYLLARLADQVAKPPQNDETEHDTNKRGEQ